VKTHSDSRGNANSRSRGGSTMAMVPFDPCFGGVIFFALTFHRRSAAFTKSTSVSASSFAIVRPLK
jgi:hypothetical protein